MYHNYQLHSERKNYHQKKTVNSLTLNLLTLES
jgi:hypothetical protein